MSSGVATIVLTRWQCSFFDRLFLWYTTYRVESCQQQRRFSSCKHLSLVSFVQNSFKFFDSSGQSSGTTSRSTATAKQKFKKCRHRNRCPQFFCDVIMSATSAWSSFSLHVLHWRYPKSERNKTRLTLAPNRGSLRVLWTYSGSVVVLSWDSTHKNTQISTLAHACHVTLTLPRSTQTRAVRPVRIQNIRLCTTT